MAEILVNGNVMIHLDRDIESAQVCHNCEIKHECGLQEQTILEIPVCQMPFAVSPGDRLKIETNPRERIAVSTSVYMLPLVSMILMSLIGHLIAGETFGIIMAFAGLAAGFLVNVLLDRRYRITRMYTIERC